MRPFPPAVLIACLAALPLGSAAAQRVLGPGPTAVTLPRGGLRVTVAGDHELFRERWNDGRREALGAGFTVPELGADHLAAIAALWNDLSSVVTLGGPGYTGPSLGGTRLDLRQRVFTTRFGLEFGITDWITVGVDVPLVRSRAEAQLRAGGGASPATAGANPIFIGSGVAASNLATVDLYFAAAASLIARRDDCQADAGSHPECPQILAELTTVNQLIGNSVQFATVVTTTYGAQGVTVGLPFVPMAGSPEEAALLQRLDAFRTAFTGYGITNITPTTGLPLGAQTPLTAAQLEAMVDTIYGARPMTRTARETIGDVDLGVRIRLFDSFKGGESARLGAARFGIRQTIGLTYRFGNGELDSPDNFIDVGTGVSANAVALKSFTDVVFNKRFWATIAIGWVQGASYDRTVRVPSLYGTEWLEPWRSGDFTVKPGRLMEVEIAPRWHLNDHLALGAQWRWRAQAPNETSPEAILAAEPYGSSIGLTTVLLDSASVFTEHRLAWTITYSTLAAASRGAARAAYEIGFTHEESVAASRGIIPRRFTDRVQLRYYPRFFTR